MQSSFKRRHYSHERVQRSFERIHGSFERIQVSFERLEGSIEGMQSSFKKTRTDLLREYSARVKECGDFSRGNAEISLKRMHGSFERV